MRECSDCLSNEAFTMSEACELRQGPWDWIPGIFSLVDERTIHHVSDRMCPLRPSQHTTHTAIRVPRVATLRYAHWNTYADGYHTGHETGYYDDDGNWHEHGHENGYYDAHGQWHEHAHGHEHGRVPNFHGSNLIFQRHFLN